MADAMAHRGPDADGFFVDGAVGLAHRRLAILDLSDRGRQPMFTSDGRFVLVFNGEIYNYIELRQQLAREGVRCRTDTDTEVLLHLYAREGSAALRHLNGMFAIAVWDRTQRELFLARDRVGIKPLYYTETRHGIAFASEAKALFAYPGITADIDVDEVDTFMTFGYVPGERTMFRGVRKLLPGHSLSVANQRLTERRYWNVQYNFQASRSARETAAQLHDLLLDATRIQLRSDVPVGVFLSGGLDSSAVVSLVSEAGTKGIKTFSVAYRDDPAYDESAFAKHISEEFATQHQVLYVEPTSFIDFIPEYVWYMDEPVTEAAALSLYFIAKELRREVTVALSGEGADELFAGYQIYRYMQWLERYRATPASFRQALDFCARLIPSTKIAKYLRLARLPIDRRYLGVSLHDPSIKSALYAEGFTAHLRDSATLLAEHYRYTASADLLTKMLYADLKAWLVDDLLIKADKMTMASSVELRVPFLDHRVVEFAATIPSRHKLRNGDVKWILKQAFASRLPTSTLRRTKVGFPTPLAAMFRDMSAYLSDLLLSPRSLSRGYFNASAVETLIAEHRRGRDHHKSLWQLVVLEEWHRAFIDRAQCDRSPIETRLVPTVAGTTIH
jgi:asparagine synthase (glutamine-hydrolysing)